MMSSAIRDDKSTRIRRRLGVYQWNEIDKRTIFHLTHSSLIHSVVVVVAYCCVPIIYLTHTQLPTDSGSVWTLNGEVNSDSRTFVFFAHENLLLFLSIILFLQKVLIFSCRLLVLLRCVGGQELNYMHRIGFHGHTRSHSKYNCRIRRPTRRLGARTVHRDEYQRLCDVIIGPAKDRNRDFFFYQRIKTPPSTKLVQRKTCTNAKSIRKAQSAAANRSVYFVVVPPHESSVAEISWLLWSGATQSNGELRTDWGANGWERSS